MIVLYHVVLTGRYPTQVGGSLIVLLFKFEMGAPTRYNWRGQRASARDRSDYKTLRGFCVGSIEANRLPGTFWGRPELTFCSKVLQAKWRI